MKDCIKQHATTTVFLISSVIVLSLSIVIFNLLKLPSYYLAAFIIGIMYLIVCFALIVKVEPYSE